MKENKKYTAAQGLLKDLQTTITDGTFTTDELSDLMDRLSWLVELASNKESED